MGSCVQSALIPTNGISRHGPIRTDPGYFSEDACVSLGSMCLQAERSVGNESWDYVGEGRGKYAKSKEFNFVGDGHGTYNKHETVISDYRLSRMCILIVAALLVMLLAVALAGGAFLAMHNKLPTWMVSKWESVQKSMHLLVAQSGDLVSPSSANPAQ
mmetsp:Transcript_103460/g.267595  ORF Transcript_103460/g.267595 Transcript_103460/m.267595 type:complete len:158 (+) Transcript_103460:71-544(+)